MRIIADHVRTSTFLLGDPVEFNWFMTGVKLSVLCDKADYDRRTREFLEKVNAIPPAPGFQSVTYPGQFEARRAAQRAVSGVTVDDNIAAKLVEMAQEKALDIPEELL